MAIRQVGSAIRMSSLNSNWDRDFADALMTNHVETDFVIVNNESSVRTLPSGVIQVQFRTVPGFELWNGSMIGNRIFLHESEVRSLVPQEFVNPNLWRTCPFPPNLDEVQEWVTQGGSWPDLAMLPLAVALNVIRGYEV